MNLKAWKAGLIVALVTGLLTGLGAYVVTDQVNWHKFLFFILACVAKDALLWLKEHPIEKALQIPLPLLLLVLCLVPIFGAGCAFQAASQYNADTKETTHYLGFATFNKSALEGLSVGKKSKTTSTVFSLEKSDTETQGDAIKAMAEAVGTAAGMAAKTAVK
jgi:hypothetical protein